MLVEYLSAEQLDTNTNESYSCQMFDCMCAEIASLLMYSLILHDIKIWHFIFYLYKCDKLFVSSQIDCKNSAITKSLTDEKWCSAYPMNTVYYHMLATSNIST